MSNKPSIKNIIQKKDVNQAFNNNSKNSNIETIKHKIILNLVKNGHL